MKQILYSFVGCSLALWSLVTVMTIKDKIISRKFAKSVRLRQEQELKSKKKSKEK